MGPLAPRPLLSVSVSRAARRARVGGILQCLFSWDLLTPLHRMSFFKVSNTPLCVSAAFHPLWVLANPQIYFCV